MINQFDITEFGAVGDGVTDCTEAVQNALDKAANCMGVVLVPPGIYCVGKLIIKGKCVSINGSSAWSFRSDGASVFRLNDDNADCMLDITGAFGCTIKGMCLNGMKKGENIHGIKLCWDKYNGGNEEDTPTIEDCRIGEFSGDGLHFEHIWCFSVRHSMLHRNGGAGLFIDGWDAFIIDNWFTANENGGIMGGNAVASITCTGNRVEWNRRGGFILPNGNSFNITGNFFDRSFGPALEMGAEMKNISLVTVTGNIFRRSGACTYQVPLKSEDDSCHIKIKNCNDTVITGNSMQVGCDDDNSGIISPDFCMIVTDCKNCIIKDNAMSCGALYKDMVLRGENDNSLIYDNIGG